MTDTEVNKIIAEYMGYDTTDLTQVKNYRSLQWYRNGSTIPEFTTSKYTYSLDALVPVWEKLEVEPSFTFLCDEWQASLIITVFSIDYISGYKVFEFCHDADTIFQAAAHATAKAILELKSDG